MLSRYLRNQMSDFLSGAAGGFAGAVGNIIGGISSQSFARKEAQKQREWTEMMWNKQNEYNSPEKMIERGLNPYLNPQAGIASSVSAGAQANQPEPFNIGSGISQGVSSVSAYLGQLAQSKRATAEAGLIDKETSWKDALNQAYLDKALGDTNYKNMMSRGFWTKERAELSAQLGLSTEAVNLANLKQAGLLMQAQEAYTILQADAQKVLNKYLDKQQQADLLNKAASYQLLIDQGRLTRRQAETEVTKQILNDAQARKIKVETMPDSVARSVFDAMEATSIYQRDESRFKTSKRDYKLDRSLKYARRNTMYWNSVNGSVNAVGNLISSFNPLKGLFRSGNSVGNTFTIDNPNGRYGYWDSSYR